MFYTSLGRLLMVDLGEDEDKFEAFMIPLTNAFESLGQVNSDVNPYTFNADPDPWSASLKNGSNAKFFKALIIRILIPNTKINYYALY